MMRVAEEGKLSFEVRTPNVATRRTMAQVESGKGERFENAEALFEDLGI